MVHACRVCQRQLELSEDLTSPAIALSENKDIFSNCDATLQKMSLYNPNIDLVNDNVYKLFG